jgi:hypothetical protein
VEKTEISLPDDLRWVTTMLLVHWIRDWGAAVGLPTVTRDGGGDRVTGDDRSRRDQVNCACANARARVLGALGGARDPEEDVPMRKQELVPWQHAWRSRQSSGRGNATWRTQGRASTGSGGRRQGRVVMRGTAGSRRWHWSRCDGERR